LKRRKKAGNSGEREGLGKEKKHYGKIKTMKQAKHCAKGTVLKGVWDSKGDLLKVGRGEKKNHKRKVDGKRLRTGENQKTT